MAALVVAWAMAPGFAGAESEGAAAEPVRFAVGLVDPVDGLAPGAEYHGARVALVIPPIRALSVVAHDPADFLARALADPGVRYVEEAPRVKLLDEVDARFVPNDPHLASQYGPEQVRLFSAWDRTLGSGNAAVCVLDTGVRATHEDLAGDRWRGGRDLVNNDADPRDDHGHGTHVTGTVGATIGNGLGVAGMGNVWLYHAKVLDSRGFGSWDEIAAGIVWCADNTPTRTVLSLSLGGGGASIARDAVQHAYNARGKLVVAAAGNGGCSNCVEFPAAYPEVIAVTCTRSGEALCSFSSTGPQAELAAPGSGILSTCASSDAAYCSMSGTSMSTPHVSGIAALYWSCNGGISNVDLRARLQQTAQDLGASGRDPQFGYGEIDAQDLFADPLPGCPGLTPPTLTSLACPASVDQRDTISCTFEATSTASGVRYSVEWGDGTTTLVPATGHVAPGVEQTATHAYVRAGVRTVNVTVVDSNGLAGDTLSATVDVLPVQSAPPAPPTLECPPRPAKARAAILCDLRTTDADSAAVAYTVDWGDGTLTRVPANGFVAPTTRMPVSHTYASGGRPTLTVTATDDGEIPATSAPSTREILVADRCAPASAGPPSAPSTAADAVALARGSVCFDGVGAPPRVLTIVASGAGTDWYRVDGDAPARLTISPTGAAGNGPVRMCLHVGPAPAPPLRDAESCAPMGGSLSHAPTGEPWYVSVSGAPLTTADEYFLLVETV